LDDVYKSAQSTPEILLHSNMVKVWKEAAALCNVFLGVRKQNKRTTTKKGK